MSIRTIMIVPEFENMEIIDRIREKYDPLAQLVRPHITLVFPFENQMSNSEIAEVLERRLKNIKPFHLVMKGICRQSDRFGHYLFLEMIEGTIEIYFIHQNFYDNEFKEYDLGMTYKPHMTIGKLATAELLNKAYEEIKNMNEIFKTVVNKISVEMIGENDESIIVVEKQLD